MRLSGWLFSVFLHVAVLAFGLFWTPTPMKINLDAPIYQVEILDLKDLDLENIYNPGQRGGKDAPKPGKPQPKPEPVAQAEDAGKKAEPVKEVKPEPTKPEPKPAQVAEHKPTPPPPPKPEPKPEPKPDAKEISPKKEEAKPEPKPEPKKEEPKKEAPKPEPAKQEPPKQPEPPKKTAEQEMAEALKDAKKAAADKKPTKSAADELADALKDVKKGAPQSGKGGGADIGKELAELQKTVGAHGGGGGGAGGIGDSGKPGLALVWGEMVKKAVRPNWRWINRNSGLRASVEIRLDAAGKLVGARLITPSGNPTYDGSVMSAVNSTKDYPVPPRGDLNIVTITFNESDR